MKLVNDLSKTICKSLSFLDNKTVRLVLIAIVVLYAAGIAPHLSNVVSNLMDSPLVKLVMIAVILCISTRDTTLALMLTIALLLSLQVNARNQVNNSINEGMADKENKENKENEEAAAEQMTDKEEDEEPAAEQMTNQNQGPVGANTSVDCLNGATCSSDPSNPCSGVQAWGAENNAQGLDCDTVRGYSANDYQGSAF